MVNGSLSLIYFDLKTASLISKDNIIPKKYPRIIHKYFHKTNKDQKNFTYPRFILKEYFIQPNDFKLKIFYSKKSLIDFVLNKLTSINFIIQEYIITKVRIPSTIRYFYLQQKSKVYLISFI